MLGRLGHFGFGPIKWFWQALFEEGNARLHAFDLGSITATWGFLVFHIKRATNEKARNKGISPRRVD